MNYYRGLSGVVAVILVAGLATSNLAQAQDGAGHRRISSSQEVREEPRWVPVKQGEGYVIVAPADSPLASKEATEGISIGDNLVVEAEPDGSLVNGVTEAEIREFVKANAAGDTEKAARIMEARGFQVLPPDDSEEGALQDSTVDSG